MPFYSPLRYPGGKRRLTAVVMRLLDENRLTNVTYVEPYAGGAAIALALLFEQYASSVHINDLSRPVYAFWHTVLNDTEALCRRIARVRVSMAEWRRQRIVYDNRETASLPALGFATLFLNRTNRSGIVDGGVIGGKDQTGPWTLGARFTKHDIVERIRRVAHFRRRITLHQEDALELATNLVPGLTNNAFIFLDPPYIENSEQLYLNTYTREDHLRLARRVETIPRPWVVTYDAAAVREGLYARRRRLTYDLNYSAQDRYAGREVMFIADQLQVPQAWQSGRLITLTEAGSRYPVHGRLKPPQAVQPASATRGLKRTH